MAHDLKLLMLLDDKHPRGHRLMCEGEDDRGPLRECCGQPLHLAHLPTCEMDPTMQEMVRLREENMALRQQLQAIQEVLNLPDAVQKQWGALPTD